MDCIEIKKDLRKTMLAKRAAISAAERKEANQKIFQSITSLPEYEDALTIFVYVSVMDEPDTTALIKDAWKQGKKVCIPRCMELGTMHAYLLQDMNDLQEGRYGIPEPNDSCQRVEPEEIDLIIVPCVCCGVDGYRLGYGGGFYDRWLEKRSAPAAILCYEDMLMSSVPCEIHDQRTDILVSSAPESVLRFPDNRETLSE